MHMIHLNHEVYINKRNGPEWRAIRSRDYAGT
jgi:hypothetical protein